MKQTYAKVVAVEVRKRVENYRCFFITNSDRDATIRMVNNTLKKVYKETEHCNSCKQLFEYQHLLLLRDIWWSEF
jgi:recombinational DNA repair protein RecR